MLTFNNSLFFINFLFGLFSVAYSVASGGRSDGATPVAAYTGPGASGDAASTAQYGDLIIGGGGGYYNEKWISLSALAFVEWDMATNTNLVGELVMDPTDKICASMFECSYWDRKTPASQINGTTVKIADNISCGDAESCETGTVTSHTIAFTTTTSATVDLGVVSFGVSFAVETSNTSGQQKSCTGGTGETVCMLWTPYFMSASFGCGLQGYQCEHIQCDTPWVCPAFEPNTISAPFSNSDGSSAGIAWCGINEQCNV